MELYKKRYNLYNYLLKDTFDYIDTKDYIYLWKKVSIIVFIILIIIFLFHFNEIDLYTIIIILIIILFIYIIYFDFNSLIIKNENNKYLLIYKEYYDLHNIIFIDSYDFTEDDEKNAKNAFKNFIKNPNDIINKTIDLTIANKDNYNGVYLDNSYLYIKINKDDNETQTFLQFNFYLYQIEKSEQINLKIDDINAINKEIKIDNLFIINSPEYNYLKSIIDIDTKNYHLNSNNKIIIKINNDQNDEEFQYFNKYIIEDKYYLFYNPNNRFKIDDINAKNQLIISTIEKLKLSQPFNNYSFFKNNSKIYYLDNPNNIFNIKLENNYKNELINFIKINKLYIYNNDNQNNRLNIYNYDNRGTLAISGINKSFIDNLISYEGNYNYITTPINKLEIYQNGNDNFYNEINKDYDNFINSYILISQNTINNNYKKTINNKNYFDLDIFLDYYYINKDIINPIIKENINFYYLSITPNDQFILENKLLSLDLNLNITSIIDPFRYLRNDGISFSFWIKSSDTVNAIELLRYNDENSSNYINIDKKTNGSGLNFEIKTELMDNKIIYTTSKTYLDDKWHNIIWTINNNGYFSIFIDNEVIIKNKRSHKIDINDDIPRSISLINKKIGNNFQNGKIKDFRVYNGSLSSELRTKIYNDHNLILMSNQIINEIKDIYIINFLKTNYIMSKDTSKITIDINKLNEYLSLGILNNYLKKIKSNLDLFISNRSSIIAKTSIINEIRETTKNIYLCLNWNTLNDYYINDTNNTFVKNLFSLNIFNYINVNIKDLIINDLRNSFSTPKIILELDYNNIKENKDYLSIDHPYFNHLMIKMTTSADNNYNNNYNKYKEIIISDADKNKDIYLKINTKEIEREKIKKSNIYIRSKIYQLIDIYNNYKRTDNIFLKDNNIKSESLIYNYLMNYYILKQNIKYNIKYNDNKTEEEINDTYYNYLKNNKDLLKYVNIYNDNYLNKTKNYLFLKKDNNNEFHKKYLKDYGEQKVIIDENEILMKEIIKEINLTINQNIKYYFIDIRKLIKLENYEKEIFNYINKKYETNFKNFNIYFKQPSLKQEKEIAKIIENYNNIYIIILIFIIIIITIIFHVFYQEIIRYIR